MREERHDYSDGKLRQILIYDDNFIHRTGYYKNGDIWYIDKMDLDHNYQGVSQIFSDKNIRLRISSHKDDLFHGIQIAIKHDVNFLP